MSLTRAWNKLLCRVLIGVFLLAQLAVAAHACQAQPASAAAEAQAHKPCAMGSSSEQLDRNASTLCAEHCHFGDKSSDTAPVPVAFAPAFALLYVVPSEPALDADSSPPLCAADPGLLAAPPPHAILHCVLRN
jgi:hypothetical protein